MKKFGLVAIAAFMLVGCGTTAPTNYVYHKDEPSPPKTIYKLKGYDGPTAMESEEVLEASRACILIKMQPKITNVTVHTDSGKLRVPVSVQCVPF